MFDRVAARYDLLNSLMSAGLHHHWRERAADRAALGPGDSALDVCCGTGDLSLELAAASPRRPRGRLRLLRADARLGTGEGTQRGAQGVRFEWADALALPYDAGRFDAVTVGFGVRNFADRDRGLREMARVLRPGGRLVVLEFTRPRRRPFSTFYSLWFDRIAPLLGRLSDDPEAYAYLAESRPYLSRSAWPGGEDGWSRPRRDRYTILAGGIVTIHSGIAG